MVAALVVVVESVPGLNHPAGLTVEKRSETGREIGRESQRSSNSCAIRWRSERGNRSNGAPSARLDSSTRRAVRGNFKNVSLIVAD